MSVACRFGAGQSGGNTASSYAEGTLVFLVAPGTSASKNLSIEDVDNNECVTQITATYNSETVISTEIGTTDGGTFICTFSDGAKLVTVVGAKGADPEKPKHQQMTVTFSLPA